MPCAVARTSPLPVAPHDGRPRFSPLATASASQFWAAVIPSPTSEAPMIANAVLLTLGNFAFGSAKEQKLSQWVRLGGPVVTRSSHIHSPALAAAAREARLPWANRASIANPVESMSTALTLNSDSEGNGVFELQVPAANPIAERKA